MAIIILIRNCFLFLVLLNKNKQPPNITADYNLNTIKNKNPTSINIISFLFSTFDLYNLK